MHTGIWKPVKGYEGRYLVSTKGQVYSIISEKLLKPQKTEKGYFVVELRGGNKRKVKKIHRLVAEAFLENPFSRTEINHKDGNKQNNTVENLEWSTRSENLIHAYSSGLKKQKTKAVDMFTVYGEFIKSFQSQKEAEVNTGIHQGSISGCCRGKNKTAGGYVWQYAIERR